MLTAKFFNILRSIRNNIFIIDARNIAPTKNVTFTADFCEHWCMFAFNRHVKKLFRLLLHWTLLILLLLFAWNQSHFQFNQYWPETWRLAIHIAMQISVVVMFIVGCGHLGDRRLVGLSLVLVATAIFYDLLGYLESGVFSLAPIKASLTAIALLPVICDPRNLKQFLLLNYWLGLSLIILSTVPLLHFLGWVDLPHESIARVGGELGRPDLNPISFYVFGRTESYAHSGFPRLQGWSSEPIHWAYFVFWTFACWLLTYPRFGSTFKRIIYWISLAFILINLWGLKSSSAWISGIFLIIGSFSLWLAWRFCQQTSNLLWIFTFFVLGPGLLIPFALGLVDGMDYLLINQSVFDEGSNWRGKIEFLNLGLELYTRFAPKLGSISISHNLLLDLYLRYGYFLLLPIILQFFILIDRASSSRFYFGVMAMLVVVVDSTLLSPGSIFLPSGVMFQMLAFAAIPPILQNSHEWQVDSRRPKI